MYKSKLIQFYKSLSKEELFELKKWLSFNSKQQHPDATKILKLLISKDKITPVVVNKERIFKQLYPKQKINLPRLRHVMSFAVISLEEFIKQKELFSNHLLMAKTLSGSYKKKNLKKYAQKNLNKAKEILTRQQQRSAQYYLNYYELELEQFELSILDERPTSTNLQEIINGFSTLFVINLLRYACTSLSHQNLYKTSYELPFLDAVLTEVKAGKYKDFPAVLMYYYSYLAQTQEDSLDSFEQLKFYVLEHRQTLNQEEYKQLYTSTINYCIKQQNSGNDAFIQEAFDWYKHGIEKAILLDNKGQISRFTYLNTITLGLKLKQFKWVRAFILEGVNLLAEQYQLSYKHYNMGKFYFATKEYHKAMPLFLQMNYDDLFMNIDIRVMQLKIYYEEQSWETLENLLNSFHVFLQRKSVMSYHKNNYLNLIKFTRILMDATMDKNQLIAIINSTTPLTERQWLLAQIKK